MGWKEKVSMFIKRKSFLYVSSILVSILGISGVSVGIYYLVEGKGGNKNQSIEYMHGDIYNIDNYPKSSLTPELKASLAHMGNEERLAYDLYQNLYQLNHERQFKNISEHAEIKHVKIVRDLVRRYKLDKDDLTNVNVPAANRNVPFENLPKGKYDIPAIQELYNKLYQKGKTSTKEAFFVGCMVEVTDINDLDGYIKLATKANAKDLIAAFTVLRNGSYNHYWAFDRSLKRIGVENGCYVEGDKLLTNKESIYPRHTRMF